MIDLWVKAAFLVWKGITLWVAMSGWLSMRCIKPVTYGVAGNKTEFVCAKLYSFGEACTGPEQRHTFLFLQCFIAAWQWPWRCSFCYSFFQMWTNLPPPPLSFCVCVCVRACYTHIVLLHANMGCVDACRWSIAESLVAITCPVSQCCLTKTQFSETALDDAGWIITKRCFKIG